MRLVPSTVATVATPAPRPAVFIDKDGTLIHDVPWNVDLALLRFTPHAAQALRRLQAEGFLLIVISNQPGIALGRFDLPALQRLAEALTARLAEDGVKLDGFYACPHAPVTLPGAWAAEGVARAEASQGPRRGAGEAVWRATQRAGNDGSGLESPQPAGSGLQGGGSGVAKLARVPDPSVASRLVCAPLQAQRGPRLLPPTLLACDCRKPAPGLLLEAARDHGVDLPRSWMVGDILDDVEAGARAGCRTVHLDVGNETVWWRSPLRVPTHTASDLFAAADAILAASTHERAAAATDRPDAGPRSE